MLSERTKNEFAANLKSGSIAPKLIFYDQDLQGLIETAQFVEKRYESTGEGSIRRRKDSSLASETEPTSRLVGAAMRRLMPDADSRMSSRGSTDRQHDDG